MWPVPMNRWYVNRWLFSTTVEDFAEAVQGLNKELERLTKDKFDLKIAFFKAANPEQGALHEKPQVLQTEITSLKDLSARAYRQADYVEATLTVRPRAQAAEASEDRPHFQTATITAKWPDIRRLDFHVEPQEHAAQICRALLDTRFTFWTRGLKLDY